MKNRLLEEIAMLTSERDEARESAHAWAEQAHAWASSVGVLHEEVEQLKLELYATVKLAYERGIQRDALLRAIGPKTVLFYDCNFSEYRVYRGTEEHMEGLRWGGGCPCQVPETYASFPGVTVVDAPAHWLTEGR